MNSLVYDYLRATEPPRPVCALAHQMATLDIALKRIRSGKSFMIAHYMGTGKTYTALFFAMYMSKSHPIIFVLPNATVRDNFAREMQHVVTYMPLDDYKLDNISFETRSAFIEEFMINTEKKPVINKLKARSFSNSVIVIDEAHIYLSNDWGRRMLELRNEADNIQFLLLTGTPVSNTIDTLSPLTNFVTGDEISIKTQNQGNKVVERTISEPELEMIMNKLKGLVSYYEQSPDSREIPEVRVHGSPMYVIPVIECVMEKEQEDDYNKTMEAMVANKKQEMFFRHMSYVSFACMGGYDHYSNFNNYLDHNREVKLARGLYLHNGVITGHWVRNMRWSTKLKYFLNAVETEPFEKRFVFFAHSKVGSVVIRSTMNMHGYTELHKEPAHDALCSVCGRKRTCVVCEYIRYAVITSMESKMNNNYIQHVLKIFNSDTNKAGRELMILFGSKIMSESHNLKEVRDVWILTVPDTHSQLFQTISRSVRAGAFENTSKPINVRILAATTSSSPAGRLRKKIVKDIGIDYPAPVGYKTMTEIYKELAVDTNSDKEDLHRMLLTTNVTVSHDIRKMLYVEIKAIHAQQVMERIKSQTCLENEPPLAELVPFIVKTKLSHFCYDSNRFVEEDFVKYARCSFISDDDLRRNFRKFVADHVVVESGECGLSVVMTGPNNETVTLPISEPLDTFYHSVVYYDTEEAERIKTMNKRYEGTYIWVDPMNNVPMIRTLTTEASYTGKRTLGNASIYTFKTPDIVELVQNRFGIDLIKRLRKSYPDQLKITDHRVKMETISIFKEFQEKYPDVLYYVSEGTETVDCDETAPAKEPAIAGWSGALDHHWFDVLFE